ncbi:hypothetical protein CBR_g52294 [Chara braunii]|uniref:Uncharacterized protein n=1 Tax=Chara braunii TaxID=69332 RepID=A0A388MA05_CHABU|nr:hypothetical protein CBR_g52294 [Chara braunii]|eukprot:GBG91407.1 hypothetical protein CBR_g52294 [Chara braunii]
MKLEDGELYNVEFVYKNTPWCKRCRWWYHTDTDGCPRADEEEEEEANKRTGGSERNRNQRWNQGEIVFQRAVRDAARDVATRQEEGGLNGVGLRRTDNHPDPVGSTSQGRNAGTDSRGLSVPCAAIPTNGEGMGGGAVPGTGLGRPGGTEVGGVSGATMAWMQYPGQGDPYLRNLQQNPMLQQPQMGYNPYGYWSGPGFLGMQMMSSQLPYQAQLPGGETAGVAMRQAGGLPGQYQQTEMGAVKEVEVDQQGNQGYGSGRPSSSQRSSAASGHGGGAVVEREYQIPEGVSTRGADDQEYDEKFILPLVCTMLGQKAFVLGLIHRNGQTILPADPICGIPGPELMEARVKQLYADRFCFRLFPEDMVSKITIDTPAGKRIKFFIVLIDARIPVPHWAGLPSVGLTCISLRVLLEENSVELSSVLVEPGVATDFLKALNEKMPLDKNLELGYIQEVLQEKWQSESPLQGEVQRERVITERIHDANAPGSHNGQD